MNSTLWILLALAMMGPIAGIVEKLVQKKVERDVADWEERQKELRELKAVQAFDKF